MLRFQRVTSPQRRPGCVAGDLTLIVNVTALLRDTFKYTCSTTVQVSLWLLYSSGVRTLISQLWISRSGSGYTEITKWFLESNLVDTNNYAKYVFRVSVRKKCTANVWHVHMWSLYIRTLDVFPYLRSLYNVHVQHQKLRLELKTLQKEKNWQMLHFKRLLQEIIFTLAFDQTKPWHFLKTMHV